LDGRYFLGLVCFGAVAVSATAGLLPALLSLFACAVGVFAPHLLTNQRTERPPRRRPLGTRPLHDEAQESLPMVPDEPSLIIELG
jgi:hypothetical protein